MAQRPEFVNIVGSVRVCSEQCALHRIVLDLQRPQHCAYCNLATRSRNSGLRYQAIETGNNERLSDSGEISVAGVRHNGRFPWACRRMNEEFVDENLGNFRVLVAMTTEDHTPIMPKSLYLYSRCQSSRRILWSINVNRWGVFLLKKMRNILVKKLSWIHSDPNIKDQIKEEPAHTNRFRFPIIYLRKGTNPDEWKLGYKKG